MVLDRIDWTPCHADAAVGAVKQRDMGLFHALGQALGIHRKAMVHRGDLDLAGGVFLDGVVGAVMAVVHLDGLATQRQRQHLMAETDTKDRQVSVVQNALDHRHRIFASGGWIAGTIGEEHAIGAMGQDFFGGGCGGQHCDIAASRGQAAQNVALGT